MKFFKKVYKTITKNGKTEMIVPKMWLPQDKKIEELIKNGGHLELKYRKVDEDK